ncbi:MAG TPA: hypothetical protein VMB05_17105 [Solirubrobacteraceae bacterium]|nr:hypothetical protein [Solirubrobacteraceae bacterium]
MEATPRTHRRARDRTRRRLEHWTIAGRAGPGPVGRLILVTPTLAPYLRKGLLKEMGAAADRLSELALCGEVTDRRTHESALWTIEATRKVLAKIGECPPEKPYAVALSRNDYPFIVYKALRSQFAAANARAQDEAVEGRSSRATVSNELASAVSALRVAITHSVTAKREAKLSGAPIKERIIPASVGRTRD